MKRLINRTYISFLITLLLLFFISYLIYKNLKTQRIEQERKKHSFRFLTHELRTPISSMLLLLDKATSRANKIDRETQMTLLEVESEVYRLKNLAQKSESILNSDNTQRYKFSIDQIIDLKEFIEDSIKQDDIQIDVEESLNFKTDLYWFGLCLQNLVDNAYKHGVSPVSIHSTHDEKKIKLYINDQGTLSTNKINLLSQDFSKEKGGLGMGLIIVKETLKALGMKLSITNTHPTQFCIEIPLEMKND